MADIDSAASAEDFIEAILQDVSRFVGGAEQYDDMTVVVVKRNQGGGKGGEGIREEGKGIRGGGKREEGGGKRD